MGLEKIEIKHNGEKILVGISLVVTPTLKDGMVSFFGVAGLKDILAQSSKEGVHVAALTGREFYFSGQAPVDKPTTISLDQPVIKGDF